MFLSAAAASSSVLISAGYRTTFERTWRSEIAETEFEELPQGGGEWRNETVRLRDVAVRPAHAATSGVVACTARVRTLRPEDAAAFLGQIRVRWRDARLPEARTPHPRPGLLAEAEIEFLAPEGWVKSEAHENERRKK